MNSRNTVQKKLVLDAVRELGCHATAEEIYNHISSVYPSISKGTVYRNLNILSESGEINKIEIPGAADCYDHVCDEHYHVICTECGRVFDVDMKPVPSLKDQINDTHGFVFTDCEIVFKGICPSCKEAEAAEQKSL